MQVHLVVLLRFVGRRAGSIAVALVAAVRPRLAPFLAVAADPGCQARIPAPSPEPSELTPPRHKPGRPQNLGPATGRRQAPARPVRLAEPSGITHRVRAASIASSRLPPRGAPSPPLPSSLLLPPLSLARYARRLSSFRSSALGLPLPFLGIASAAGGAAAAADRARARSGSSASHVSCGHVCCRALLLKATGA